MTLNKLFCAISLAAVTATAQAQFFDNFVVFGDSLLDSGHFPDPGTGGATGLTFTNRTGPTYLPPEPTAPIAVDNLADYLGLELQAGAQGGSNFAIGGSQTAQIQTAIETYVGASATTANTLFMVSGGGNDFLFGTITDASSLVNSVNNMSAGINALQADGANYIAVLNLPDLGSTAASQAGNLIDPTTSTVASAGAANYNATLATAMNGTGANIIPIDLNGLLSLIASEPTRFGLASGTINIGIADFEERFMCFDGSGGDCVEHPVFGVNGAAPDPSQLIFNDGVHPTTAATAIFSDYMTSIFAAPVEVASLTHTGVNIARSQVQNGAMELRQSRWAGEQARWYFAAELSEQEQEGFGAATTDNQSISVGFIRPLSDNWVAGLGFTVGNQEATPNISSFESSSFGVNGLMGYRDGRWFADASLGLSVVDYDSLKRTYRLGSQLITAQGDTAGFSWGLDTLVGYNLLGEGELQLAPAVGLQWLDTEVDGYTESGGEVSNYEWGSLSQKSMQWRLGFVGQWQVASNFGVSAEIFAAQEQEDGRQNLQLRNTNLAYNSFHLPGFEADESSLVTSSVSMAYQKQDSKFRLAWNYNSVGDGFSQLLLSYSRPL